MTESLHEFRDSRPDRIPPEHHDYLIYTYKRCSSLFKAFEESRGAGHEHDAAEHAATTLEVAKVVARFWELYAPFELGSHLDEMWEEIQQLAGSRVLEYGRSEGDDRPRPASSIGSNSGRDYARHALREISNLAEPVIGLGKGPITEFLEKIIEAHSPVANVLVSPGARSQIIEMTNPVLNARQKIIDAYEQCGAGRQAEALSTLDLAIKCADSGSVAPDNAEWPIDGSDVGRAHACMWGGIARTFAHQQSSDWMDVDATKADAWFGVATLFFLKTANLTMAGRTIQEWAESRRLLDDRESQNLMLFAAMSLFESAGEGIDDPRRNLAHFRMDMQAPVWQASSFLHGEPPTEVERMVLGTVLGASNADDFYNALR